MLSSSTEYDVVIVGAGPAGSSAAIRLSLSGMSVLLVEQKKFPREKLCGEFISPECISHFEELGVMSQIRKAGGTELNETIFFTRNGRSAAVPSAWFGNANSLALGLSRSALDDLLLDRAIETGVHVRAGKTASALLFDKLNNKKVTGVMLRDEDGLESKVLTKLMIDATGRTRSLARRLERPHGKKRAAKFVAFKTHLRGASVEPGVCEIYGYRGGYGGCSKVEADLYNLCFIAPAAEIKRVGGDAQRSMDEIVFSNRRAAEALRFAEPVKPWLAVPIERFGRGELVPANGLITIGDAAAFIDPFTGSGILMALDSAQIAADAVIKGVCSNRGFQHVAREYKYNYGLAFDRRLRVCSILRHASFIPFWAEATVALLSSSVGLRRRIARATRFSAEQDV